MKQCMDAENLHRRLKKIIGQVQAIDRMIDEDVPCEDILSQINAAESALNGCGNKLNSVLNFEQTGFYACCSDVISQCVVHMFTFLSG